MTDNLGGLGDVQLHLVDSVDKAREFISWLGERRPHNAIAIDIETGELPGGGPGSIRTPGHGDGRCVHQGAHWR